MNLLRRSDGKATLSIPERACKVCGDPFIQYRSTQTICAKLKCATQVGKLQRKAEKAETKRRKEAIKTRAQWLAEAKKAVQRFRRLEELSLGHGCISCERTQEEVNKAEAWKPGGAWDGGHYIGKGAAPELALEPLNIWLQCKSCNGGAGNFARKAATVHAAFRLGLIARQGQEFVEWLEGPHAPKKYTIPDLISIRDESRARAKELER